MAAKKAAKKKAVSDVSEPKAPRKIAAKKVAVKVAKKALARPSIDAIARAAYLNYRRRVEQGLPGDSHSDWLDAERQTLE